MMNVQTVGTWYRRFAVVMLIVLLIWPAQGTVRAETSLLDQLQQTNQSELVVRTHPETGAIASLRLPDDTLDVQSLRRLSGADAGIVAQAFVRTYGSLFGLGNLYDSIRELRREVVTSGSTYVKYQQYYKGIPIVAGEIVVGMSAQRRIRSVHADILPMSTEKIDVTPKISTQDAKGIATSLMQRNLGVSQQNLTVSEPNLWIFNPKLLGGPQLPITTLNWRMEVTGASAKGAIREFVLVNAHTGAVTIHFSQINHALNQRICNNNSVVNTDLTSANNCLSDAQAARLNSPTDTGNVDVDTAWEFTKATYDYYKDILNRDSIDNYGMRLVSVVNYCEPNVPEWDYIGCPYANAYWDGFQMTYGAGYANADDVVAHELTHGVTEYTARLFYYYQSGAINEALSDIFGELVDRAHDGRSIDNPSDAWLMGEDLSIGAIRNMQNPPMYDQPDRMSSSLYYGGAYDGGGVHTNSGVANKAAYLLIAGGSFNGQEDVISIGDTKTARLFYGAMTQYLTSGSDYADLADALVATCDSYVQDGLYSYTSDDCTQVDKAILATEMIDSPTNAPATEAEKCSAGLQPRVSFQDTFSDSKLSQWKTSPSKTWFSGAGFYSVDGSSILYGYLSWKWKGGSSTSQLKTAILIPEQSYMHFEHAYDFDTAYDAVGYDVAYSDGGVIEYSSDGKVWTDATSLITVNGYTGSVGAFPTNPLAGKSAYVGTSNGYISSRLDLSSLAGQKLFFRFRIGGDRFGSSSWFIDNFMVYTCVDSDTNVVQLAGSGDHTCATTIGEDILCWGRGDAGQIGNGASVNATKANFAVNSSDERVSTANSTGAGGGFSCAIQPTKRVACWGANTSGQLGNNTLVASNKAVTVLIDATTPLTDVVSLATGSQHACAVRANSSVYCWGENGAGQLGNGTEIDQKVAVLVQQPDLGLGSTFYGAFQVVAGADHTCTLMFFGFVACWGDNSTGELGVGATVPKSTMPLFTMATAKKELTGIRSIAAGADATCALTTKAALMCWGRNTEGQMGNGTYTNVFFPTAPKVGKKALTNVTQVAMGLGSHVCAVDTSKNIYCWGANANGQLGLNSTDAKNAPTLMNATIKSTIGTAVKLSVGLTHTCAMNTKLAVYCWGNNSNGQLGEGGYVASSLLPLRVINSAYVELGLP